MTADPAAARLDALIARSTVAMHSCRPPARAPPRRTTPERSTRRTARRSRPPSLAHPTRRSRTRTRARRRCRDSARAPRCRRRGHRTSWIGTDPWRRPEGQADEAPAPLRPRRDRPLPEKARACRRKKNGPCRGFGPRPRRGGRPPPGPRIRARRTRHSRREPGSGSHQARGLRLRGNPARLPPSEQPVPVARDQAVERIA